MASGQPGTKKPDRWSGEFSFSTCASFDLSKVVSTRSCKDKLLFTVFDQVSDLKKELQVVDLETFIFEEEEMALFKKKTGKEFYQLLSGNAGFRPELFSVFQDVRKVIKELDEKAQEEPASAKDYSSLLLKV